MQQTMVSKVISELNSVSRLKIFPEIGRRSSNAQLGIHLLVLVKTIWF